MLRAGSRSAGADSLRASQATSSTYECAGIKDGDEFERLKAALAAFDITGDVRGPARAAPSGCLFCKRAIR